MITLEKLLPSYLPNAENIVQILKNISALDGVCYSKDALQKNSSFANRSGVLAALDTLESTRLLRRTSPGIYALNVSKNNVQELITLLRGALIAESLKNHSPAFQVVMTSPKKPNELQSVLEKIGPQRCQIQRTDEIFKNLAKISKSRFSIMTPFLDKQGADFLLKLFASSSPEVERRLVLRFLSKDPDHPKYPKGFDLIKTDLERLNVSIFDYAIRRDNSDWMETFHAKAILADDSHAYIGSSNMDRYSLDNSLELGVFLTGDSVLIIKELLDGIISISHKV